MKKIILISSILVQSFLAGAHTNKLFADTVIVSSKANNEYAGKLQQLMDKYTVEGIPGIAVAVYHPAIGFWEGASGFARIENKTAMQPSHLQYSQSVSKTYTAVILLQMQEQGLINLDSPAANYLPEWVNKKIPYTNEFTVRMMLNHSTGLPDYAEDNVYVVDLLQNPFKKFTTADFVDYIASKKRLFMPGTDYSYCNMNTELAALIADKICGDHAHYMNEHIFQKLDLQHTFYHTPGYLDQPLLVNSYWDRYSNGIFENVTNMQRTNVGNMIGDDGLIATPMDYVKFMKSLFEEKLISGKSLAEMMTQVKGKDGQLHGGLGLFKLSKDGVDGYFHGGAGVGAGCMLLYVPAKQVCIFLGTNMGTITEGPFSTKANEFKEQLLNLLLQ